MDIRSTILGENFFVAHSPVGRVINQLIMTNLSVKEKDVYFLVYINDNQVRVMISECFECSVIAKDLVDKSEFKMLVTREDYCVNTSGQKRTDLFGKVELRIKLGDTVHAFYPRVFDNCHQNMVLGLDFINATKAAVVYDKIYNLTKMVITTNEGVVDIKKNPLRFYIARNSE